MEKLRKLTLRQSAFIDHTIETLNPTEAVRRTYNLGSLGGKDTENTARMIASDNLTKPNIIQELKERMEKRGLTLDKITQVHKRNAVQSENLPASNTAVDMYYKIHGAYAPEKKMNVNIDLTGDDTALEAEIKAIRERLDQLDDESISPTITTPLNAE